MKAVSVVEAVIFFFFFYEKNDILRALRSFVMSLPNYWELDSSGIDFSIQNIITHNKDDYISLH